MMNGILFSHHLLAAFRTAYLKAGNTCLVRNGCSTLGTDTFAARACSGTVAAHAAALPAACSPANSRAHSFWSGTITLRHDYYLPY
jgi:hypothetical protein